jgi:hypothetical protein
VEEINLTSTIFLIFAEFVANFAKVFVVVHRIRATRLALRFSAVTGQRVTASDKMPPS